MKRKSIISLGLAGTMLLSMYGTALANTTQGLWNFGSDSSAYFNWTWIDYDKTLEFSKSSVGYGATTSFQEYFDLAEHVIIKDTNNYSSYEFNGVPDSMNSVEDLTIYNNCKRVSDIRLFENLETIKISNNYNTDGYVVLDMMRGEFDTLPEIETTNISSDLKIYANCSNYWGYSVTIPACYSTNSNLYYDFSDSPDLGTVYFESGTEVIPEDAFAACTGLNEAWIPDGVTLIEYNAFSDCSDLDSINLPSSITEIKSNAFEDSGIEWIDFGGTVDDWMGLVQDYDDNKEPVEGATVLHLDDVLVYCSDGQVYIYEEDGEYYQTALGWKKENGKWRYYDQYGPITDQFIDEDGSYYYVDKDGYMVTGWMKDDSNDWLYFASNGKMVTGWKKIGGSYYYFDTDGTMQTGWFKDGSKWYYLGSDGKMVTGWQKISNKWYYFQSSGAMVTGWQKISNKWYYFQSSGAMKTGWQKSGSSWYYLGSDGAMLTNCSRKIGNKTYNFDANGVCTNP